MLEYSFKRISVVGLGYIGLPTAAMFASRKIEVIGLDVDQRVVDMINCAEIHIVEPDLDIVVRAAVTEGYLSATTVAQPADAFLIAVPTPFRGENHEPDLSYVEAASKAIAPVLQPGNLVILESTSPVGTTEAMAGWLAESRPDLSFPQTKAETPDIRVAYCPERVLPGKVMEELIINDRIIGGMTAKCSAQAVALYKSFVTGECVVASGPRVAEMAKLTENSFRDVNIAFANELSLVCDALDINVWELIQMANRHPRVNILQPGPGVGGHCIAVDPWFIVNSAPNTARLIRTAREVNDSKPEWVLEKVHAAIGSYLVKNPQKTAADVTIALYGLSFKPDIDDLRESPALAIARRIEHGHAGPIMIVEPMIDTLPKSLVKSQLVEPDEARTAAISVLLVDHTSFKTLDVPETAIVDTKGLWV